MRELREKIAKFIYELGGCELWDIQGVGNKEYYQITLADPIIDLFQPLINETKKEITTQIFKELESEGENWTIPWKYDKTEAHICFTHANWDSIKTKILYADFKRG